MAALFAACPIMDCATSRSLPFMGVCSYIGGGQGIICAGEEPACRIDHCTFWVGRRLLQQGRAVAADFEDWHSEDLLPEARRHRPIRLLRSLERDLLRLASYTTTTSTALADSLHRTYGGKKPFVVTNSFPLQTLPSVRALNEPPSFFWFSQTVGPGRGLEQFIRAWSATRHPSRLVLLGAVSNGFPERLRALMPADRRSHVEFMDPVSPQKLPAVIASHDVGLALELPSPPSRDLTITNKILQYLNAGLAVVASDTVGQREVLTRGPGAGILVNLEDGPRFTAALDNLLAAPAQLTAMREAARKLAEDFYCWESESRAFKQIVADSMSTIQR
jgi:glycosyltransferase involved in cell wall biosynthesis